MKFLMIVLSLLLLPVTAVAEEWRVVHTLSHEGLFVPYEKDLDLIRTAIDGNCSQAEVACRAVISSKKKDHSVYADEWHASCQKAVGRAFSRKGGVTWEVLDLRKRGEHWRVEPVGQEGPQIVCRPKAKPSSPEPPKVREEAREPEVVVSNQAVEQTARSTTATSAWFHQLQPRLEVVALTESFYQVARKEIDLLALAGLGFQVNPWGQLSLGARGEIGAMSTRENGSYLWAGGRLHADYRALTWLTVGGVFQHHRGWIGQEPYRDRSGVGMRACSPGLFANDLGLEVNLILARDATPAFTSLQGISFTSGNDITVGASVGINWEPKL